MFAIFTLGYLCGTCLLFLYFKLSYLIALLFIMTIFILIAFLISRKSWIFLLGVTLGLVAVSIHTFLVINNRLLPDLEKKPIQVVGLIKSFPESRNFAQHFMFETIKICTPECKKKHYRLKLSWNNQYQKLAQGELWQFQVKLKRPYSTYNPWAWDYEKYLLREKISAIGYVAKGDNKRLKPRTHTNFHNWRQEKLNQLINHFANKAYLSLYLALSFGYRGLVTLEQWKTFQYTGTNHLIAIAGLHLGFVTGLVFFISQKLWSKSAKLCLIFPTQRAALVIAWVFGACYSLISGLELPARRAIFMLSVYLLSVLLLRNNKGMNNLAIALLVILIWDPLSVLSESFWLSFFAVFAIFYGLGNRLSLGGNKFLHYLKLQACLSLSLIPLTLYFFQVIPLTSFLVNILFIPMLGFILLPWVLISLASFFIFPQFSEPLINNCLKSLGWFYQGLHFFAERSNWILHWGKPVWWTFILSIVGILWLLAPRGFPLRYLGIACCFPLFFYQPVHKLKENEFELTVFDVGQGLAALVRTKNHHLLYDTGTRFGDYNAGEAIILPYLASNHIKHLDYLILSHGDSDHSGGVKPILEQIKIEHFLSSVPERFPSSRFCQAGEKWVWDEVSFEILFPGKEETLSGNNRSCVLKISSTDYSALLVGDIEKSAEESLLSLAGSKLASTLLIAPHHGSKTSSSWPFLLAAHPQYVIFSTGYLNRFHFPHPKILSRYQAIQTKMLNTADTGLIQFYFGKSLNYKLWRMSYPYIWNKK